MIRKQKLNESSIYSFRSFPKKIDSVLTKQNNSANDACNIFLDPFTEVYPFPEIEIRIIIKKSAPG